MALADRLWAELPRSAGRRDVVAKDLGRVRLLAAQLTAAHIAPDIPDDS